MEDGDIPPHKIQDPAELNAPGLGLGRDPERTPMQWDSSANAGFCPEGVEPWLPVAPNYEKVNVVREKDMPNSMLTFTRRLIDLRQQSSALLAGNYGLLQDDGDLLVYSRELEGEGYLVVLNFGSEEQGWPLPEFMASGRIVLSTNDAARAGAVDGSLAVAAHEGVIFRFIPNPP
jgi:alpha-glucosidase